MTELIAETAWHHQGDFIFMKDLVSKICEDTSADFIKFHITLDLDEYMASDHESYETLKSWMFTDVQWQELIEIVKGHSIKLMLLLNDTKAISFSTNFNPALIELHSVCMNVPRLQYAIKKSFSEGVPIVIGVGGSTLEEVAAAAEYFDNREIILMFGFQNYPTKYEDINLGKIRKIQSLYKNLKFGYADHTAWDEDNNELISLMVGANGMNYIEKHVTTVYGQIRCDSPAAISIEMFNSLDKKIKILDEIYGDGSISLNIAEQEYSKYGPMKMAAIVKSSLTAGMILKPDDINFIRTSQNTDLSQIEVLNMIGKKIVKKVNVGQVLKCSDFH